MTAVLQRNTEPIRMRNYGRIIQDLVAYACTMEPSPQRDALVVHIALCMRQKNVAWNKDQDAGLNRVKEDIQRLSNNRLNCNFELFETRVMQSSQQRYMPQQSPKRRKANK